MTIQEALNVSQRSVSYRDAEVFMQLVLQVERGFLHTYPETVLTEEQAAAFERCLSRREANEPVAYIVGHKEFYGRPFKTDSRALIPRPETEGLIDRALAALPDRFHAHLKATNKPCPLRILEIGTGAGNIAITLSLELTARSIPNEILATDISSQALALAEENWSTLKSGPSPLKFLEADLLNHPDIAAKAPYDLIIANLPYVPLAWRMDPAAQPEVVFQEPEIALFGGDDGLDLYRRFFADAPALLMPDGIVLVEYGEDETGDITHLATPAFPNHTVSAYKDYADLDRVLEILPK